MSGFGDFTTLEHCLLELILNSLKAQATAIAVRIHLCDQRIQVVDNGSGISKNALKYVAEYFAEKENPSALKYKNVVKEGSLDKIRKISSRLVVISRSKFTTETYRKLFNDGKVSKMQRIDNRPCSGTTITVYASSKLWNWRNKTDYFAVKLAIVWLSLVNTQVSFSVRDDMRQSIVFGIRKFQKVTRSLRIIFEKSVSSRQVQHIKTQILGKLKISGFWGVECTDYKRIQQVLLNLRPAHCPVLEKFMINIITKICYPRAENTDHCVKQIFFLVYIECPDSEYNLSVKDINMTVDFHQIDQILDTIEKSLGKAETKEFKPSKAFFCKSIIPPLVCHPTGRIPGVKRKRSFLTNVSRHNFKITSDRTQIKRKVKALIEIKKFTRFDSEDSNFMNRDIAPPVPHRISSVDSAPKKDKTEPLLTISTKEHQYEGSKVLRSNQRCIKKRKHDKTERLSAMPTKGHEYEVSQISPVSQECIKKRKCNKTKPLPITSNTSRNINVSIKNNKYEKLRILKVNESWDEKPHHDRSKSLPMTQSTSQAARVPTKKRDYDNYMSRMSPKLIEKSRCISEIPIISQNWRSDSEAVELNCRSQKSDKQSQKLLGKLESKIANKTMPTVKEYQYDNHGVLWISQKCNEKLSNRVEETYDIGCSQWSNWTYEPDLRNSTKEKPYEAARPILYQRFRFLPLNLHALLPFLNEKLISKDLSEDFRVPMNLKFNHRRQDLDVRPCTRHYLEFRLKMESLKSMKVLNQVNQEFIVALTKQDDMKLVVVIDQHAMHERIRYENLLRAYKRDQKNQQLISVALHRPIIISDFSASTCSLLSSNQALLALYGLNIAFRNQTTLLIFAVPRCFLKKTFRADNTEVEIAARKLLREVLDNLTTNGTKKLLPLVIHDAIASEACHGAIKFGDPLTLKQCESLVSCWKDTDVPNRCAHGRPSVVPLLELSSHRRNNYELVCQGGLNFASLQKFRRSSEKRLDTTLTYHPYVKLKKNRESRFQCDDEALR